MKTIALTFTLCIIAAMLLTSCGGAGNSGAGGSGLGGGGGDSGGGIVPPGDDVNPLVPHHPEPATTALLGTGLAAFALLRRKKK